MYRSSLKFGPGMSPGLNWAVKVLQALHASAPLIAIWDDHEHANNPWRDGAENHNEDGSDEGAALFATVARVDVSGVTVVPA